MNPPDILVRMLGTVEYTVAWDAMRAFNQSRTDATLDEIWLLQHPPVYTQGLNVRPDHKPDNNDIPIIESDRGGDITYHGPGQLLAYLLIDVKRKGWGIRQLVHTMEESIITLLDELGIKGDRRQGAPGIYVNEKKIASLGLRIRRGGSYHGLALNVDMDLNPFGHIPPCGFRDLRMTQIRDLVDYKDMTDISHALLRHLLSHLRYTEPLYIETDPRTDE